MHLKLKYKKTTANLTFAKSRMDTVAETFQYLIKISNRLTNSVSNSPPYCSSKT